MASKIKFKDFVPQVVEKEEFLGSVSKVKCQPFEVALKAANDWIDNN